MLFLGFMAAFAIKAPLFPFHTWLPLVHTEAPTAGSVVLAGVILKMGAYGFAALLVRAVPAGVGRPRADPDRARGDRDHLRRDRRGDADRPETVIAYSSVAHMGFVVLGIFSLTVIGLDGAVFTMLSHPLTTGALFLVVGMLYERRHTREIVPFRGLWKVTPVLGGLFLDRARSPVSGSPASRASSASSCRCSARSSSTGRTRSSPRSA